MRRIAVVNQKGGVGKTTTAVNLGSALAERGRSVVLLDLDPQSNLSTHLGITVERGAPSTYSLLTGETPLGAALRGSGEARLLVVPTNLDLSGAELELASAIGREGLLRDAIDAWEEESRGRTGQPPADYLIVDCPPSLGLLSINGLVAAREVFIALQTEFFALQGLTKLLEIVQLLRKRLNPTLEITGIVPCLYDTRLRLAREVLAEIRSHFPGQVFKATISENVKLAEAPSYGRSILAYAPESVGARDYRALAAEVAAQELEAPLGDSAPALAQFPQAARPASARESGGNGAPRRAPPPRPRPTESGAGEPTAPARETARETARDNTPEARAENRAAGSEPLVELVPAARREVRPAPAATEEPELPELPPETVQLWARLD